MKKNIKCFLILIFSTLLLCCFSGCNPQQSVDSGKDKEIITGSDEKDDQFHKGYEFDYVPHYGEEKNEEETSSDTPEDDSENNPSDNPGISTGEDSNYPTDTGVKTAFRMEGEDALINTDAGTLYDCKFLGFDLRFSQCLATRNLNAPSMHTAYEFKFNSSTSLKDVDLNFCLSVNSGKTKLSELFTLEVNSYDVNTQSVALSYSQDDEAWGLYEGAVSKEQYMHFKTVTAKISIKQGINTIKLKDFKNVGGNLDYIELNTSAVISNYTKTPWNDSSIWEVTKEPTALEEGTIKVTSTGYTNTSGNPNPITYTLPKLEVGKGYSIEDKETYQEYSFMLKGQKYSYQVAK